MFQAIFISRSVNSLTVQRLDIISEDFLGHSLNGKQLSQVANDSIGSGRGHLKQEGVLEEIIYG